MSKEADLSRILIRNRYSWFACILISKDLTHVSIVILTLKYQMPRAEVRRRRQIGAYDSELGAQEHDKFDHCPQGVSNFQSNAGILMISTLSLKHSIHCRVSSSAVDRCRFQRCWIWHVSRTYRCHHRNFLHLSRRFCPGHSKRFFFSLTNATHEKSCIRFSKSFLFGSSLWFCYYWLLSSSFKIFYIKDFLSHKFPRDFCVEFLERI